MGKWKAFPMPLAQALRRGCPMTAAQAAHTARPCGEKAHSHRRLKFGQGLVCSNDSTGSRCPPGLPPHSLASPGQRHPEPQLPGPSEL